MKYDVILAGVGGQGVLSVAAVIAYGAMREGLEVKQSEVHGMAQRGGAVEAHLRIADGEIKSDLIGRGRADMVLSIEPLESLRYLDYLHPDGIVVTSKNPFVNIPNYPEEADILTALSKVPHNRLVDANGLAKQAGSARATNMVMVGAASAALPVRSESLLNAIKERFSSKGEGVVEINCEAFRLGSEVK